MYVGAHLFEPFFVFDTEVLFLIHNHQAEIAKLHTVSQQSVSADDDIDMAFSELLFTLFKFFARNQP